MSTAPESGGRPINGDRVVNANNIHANKSDNNSCSVTSTVVLDPAAFLANWKKQIQGKDNIPVHQQRLTFASNHHPYPGIKLFDWSCASQDQSAKEPVVKDFFSSLQSWQAILRSEKRNIARLLDPEVLTESGDLPSDLKNKIAEEIRDLGIPCTVYYLLFNKCIQVLQPQNCQGTAYHCKEISNLCIKVDKDFQLKEFEVDLYGRLSKSSQPLHFSYQFNGGHLVANLSMLEQTEQYRQGQKMRHNLVKSINSVHKLADGSLTESLLDTNRTSTSVKRTPVQYYIHVSEGLTVIIHRTSDCELRGICVPVIILDVSWQRLVMGPRNNLIERKLSTPESFTEMPNNREGGGQTQHGNSHHAVNPTTANPLSEPKTCDFEQKRSSRFISRKSKSSCNSEFQLSKSAQDDSSSSFQTDSSNGCSSTKPADSLKSGDTLKKASKKKRRKKNKRNSKNSSSDTSAPVLKENVQESDLPSDVYASSISGNGHIPYHGSIQESSDYLNFGDAMFVKSKIETTSDLEMCTTPIDKTMDKHFSCGTDLSNHDAAFVPRQTRRTGSLIPGNCNDGLWDSESRHQTDLLSTLDGKAPSCDHYSEENCSDCGSSVYNTHRGNVNDSLMVDSNEKHKDATQVIRARDSQSVDKKLQAPVGNKVAGNICGSACFPSGSTNRIEKESKHRVCWQKIEKHMANDAFHESGTGDNVQLRSGTIQIQRTNSETYSEYEVKHNKQKKGSENYLEHCASQNHTTCYDAQSRCEDSNKSQEGRGVKSQCSNRQIVGSTHKNAKKTGKDFKVKKTGRSHSDRPIQSKSFAAHENAEKPDNDHVDKRKSSSAPSTPCQCGDVIQSNRGDFFLSRSCKLNHNEANQMLPLSSISNSSDQELLPTKNQGNEITSDVHMLEVQLDESIFRSSFKKTSKTTDSGIRASGESDIKQYATEREVFVEVKSAGMMMATTDTVGAHSQRKDTVNNVHEGSSENSKLDVSEVDLESIVPLQKMGTSPHVKQTNDMETQQFHEISCKCSSFISKSPASSSAGLNKMAQDISDSIFASYQSQLALESIAHAIGSPLAEFEKVLYSVAPVIVPRPQTICTNHPRKLGITELVCRCQIADVPLKNIWHWFEKPGNYGLEVKAEDFQYPKRFSTDGNLFRAYFVPFLSGIQLFRFSEPSKLCSKGAFRSEMQENNQEMRKVEDSYHSHFEHLPILSTLLPKPFAAEKTEAPVRLESCKATRISSSVENQSCSHDLNEGMEILFEYFECEQPQQRRPMFEKIRELIKNGAGSSFQVFGDQHTLESINLRDLHPASWFSVAWYPIYRLPEGQFRAAFLTYHSLGHFVHRDGSPDTFDGDIGSCIVAPVVGLQSYNAQAECWFVPKKQCELVLNENISSTPSEALRERLRTLEETASLLARKCARKDASMASSKQSDYEFFLSRGRQSVITS